MAEGDKTARPLWASSQGQPSEGDIPACSICGGPRTFEFQIMPQMIHLMALEDAAAALDHEDGPDFATVCVYTCSESCEVVASGGSEGGGGGYASEVAWVQQYPVDERLSPSSSSSAAAAAAAAAAAGESEGGADSSRAGAE